MYSVVPVIYVAILAIDALLLLVAWSQTRSARSLVGALLSVLVMLLLLIPDSTLLGFIGRTFSGSFGLYLASFLYAKSKEGVVVYGILVVVTAAIGWVGGRRAEGSSQARHHRNKR